MGRHSTTAVRTWHPFNTEAPFASSTSGTRRESQPRQRPARIPAFLASCASAALVLVFVVDPYSGAYANATPPSQWRVSQDSQTFVVADGVNVAVRTNLDWTIIEPPPPPVVAPATGTPDPGSAKAIALNMVTARGWDAAQYDCLVSLWNKESGWNQYAENKSSGAYGIPQAYPGSKMASAGADWKTNAATQITWGIGYIAARYSTPCGAWMNSQAKGSY